MRNDNAQARLLQLVVLIIVCGIINPCLALYTRINLKYSTACWPVKLIYAVSTNSISTLEYSMHQTTQNELFASPSLNTLDVAPTPFQPNMQDLCEDSVYQMKQYNIRL